MRTFPILMAFCVALAFSQVTTGLLDGSVTDPQGALVAGAEVTVTNADTGQIFKASTDGHGHWLLPSMAAGNYTVSVSLKGFRTTTITAVKMDAGVPKTVNASLEVGQVTEVVEVMAKGELIQTSSATVSSTVQQRMVMDLPFTSRGGMDLLVTQPGVQTGTTARTSFINGLPLAAMSVTIDGINTQDNYYKNGDGFFTLIPARQDSLEEITLSSAASGADSNAQGAATVKFITKGGTNEFHGGVFWQHRNTALNANSYFNNINGQPRNKVILNQGGVNIGGPIIRNKLLFFTNLEIYRYPAQTSTTRTVIRPEAMNGDFTYPVSGGLQTVNVLQKAAAAGYVSTVDPIIASTLNDINALTKNGTLQDRIVTNQDYNRKNLLFQPKGLTQYWTNTTRLDYNITQQHTFQVVYTYYTNTSAPDITNSVVGAFPGTGIVLGYDDVMPSQGGNRYAASMALRSSLKPAVINEVRFGLNRGITIFRGEVAPSMFSRWKGYAPSLGFSLSNVYAVNGSSRRTSPVRELHDTVSMQKGSHTLTFGADISQIGLWYQTVGNSVIPTMSFGVATNDPVNTGTTSIFTAANFPGATSTQLSDAAGMYAMLTGRVSAIGRSVAYDGQSYKAIPPTERDRQYEWGAFGQDSWKVTPGFTLNLGLRFEQQKPFQNLDQVYSAVSYQSLWGVSGVGNMFKPGVMTGSKPVFERYNSNYYKTPNMWNPSVGLAWQLPGTSGPLGRILGQEKGRSVIRAGYAIASVRNGSYTFQNLLGTNQGLNYDTSVNPGSYPAEFGAPGSVLLRDAAFPARSYPDAPQYPLTPQLTNSMKGYDPNLKMAYVQSWNLGLQRELSKSTVMEVRYTGNHGLKAWRQVDLNEVNLTENGFLKEFYTAQNNLWINRGCKSSWNDCTSASSTNFGNAGLAGQGAIPLIQTGLNYSSDTTVANYLRQNRPGSVAGLMYNDSAAMTRLTGAGYPANLFVVNPTVAGGGAYLLTNMGSSNYHALQVEVNRHMSARLLMQGSYVWSHSIVNGSESSLTDFNQPTTLRNLGLDKVPGSYDIRHAFKLNGAYELPFGTGRRFLSSANSIMRAILGGWEVTGIGRVQSGTPFQLTSGRTGMNTGVNSVDTGVVLNNVTGSQLQDMVQFRKTTGSNLIGQVLWLPDDLIANTSAAFELNGKTWANLDPTKPYIGPQLSPNSFGYRVYLRQPWQYHLDVAALKRTNIGEQVKAELQVNFIDILNMTNFFIANGPSSTSLGRTTSYFNDFSGSADPGSRVIEFRLRVRF